MVNELSCLKTFTLSIVIPAFNEEKRILQTIKNILFYLSKEKFSFELIVVDDGSTDNSTVIINKLALENDAIKLISLNKNYGKGYAVKIGMLAAKGDYLLFMDADGAANLGDIESLLSAIQSGASIAIGSRNIPNNYSRIESGFLRRVLRKTLNYIVRFFLFKNIYDTQCGFKMFTKAVAKDIFEKQQIYGYGFHIELLLIAKLSGYTIKEVPISWKSVAGGEAKTF